jgi:hypothetical protein
MCHYDPLQDIGQIRVSIYTHLTKFKEDQAVYALNEHLDEMIETRQFLTTIQ